jgi:heat shock protein HslJ
MQSTLLPRRLFPLFAAIALACLTAACTTHTGKAQAEGPQAQQASTTADSFADTVWALDSWTDKGGAARPLPDQSGAGQPITLAFVARNRDYTVNGFTGCNRYNGTYTFQNRQLVITVIGSTRMACQSDSLARIEKDYLNALKSISSFTLDNAGAPRKMTLNLRNGDILTFSRREDVPTKL